MSNERKDSTAGVVRGGTLTVQLAGGLANQLFQWASVCALLESVEAKVLWDSRMVSRPGGRGDQLSLLGLVQPDNVVRSSATRVWAATSAMLPRRVYPHVSRALRPRGKGAKATTVREALLELQNRKSVYLTGYLQDVELIDPFRARLSGLLRPAIRSLAGPFDLLANTPYTAVHVRRGDYVESAIVQDKFGPPALAYYQRAIEQLSTPPLVITDDPVWCREVLAKQVECHSVVETGSHWTDLNLLMDADEIVLSNSTFSWWGAFAGTPRKVLAPSPWLDDPQSPDLSLSSWERRDKKTGVEVLE